MPHTVTVKEAERKRREQAAEPPLPGAEPVGQTDSRTGGQTPPEGGAGARAAEGRPSAPQAPEKVRTAEKCEKQEEDDGLSLLFDRRVSVPLTAENARFTRSKGGLISLTLTDPEGKEEFFERVVPIRAFPISSPDEFISVREPDTELKGPGAEIGLIRRLSDFSEAEAALITEELEKRYFTPIIRKIHSFSEKFGYRYFDVTTTTGRIEFIMNTSARSIRTLEDGRVFLYDIDGNCFAIEDPRKLDKASYRKIEMYL